MWIAQRQQTAPIVGDSFVGIDKNHSLAAALAFYLVPEFGGKLRDLVTGQLAQFPAGVSHAVDAQGRVLLFDGTSASRLTFPDGTNIVRTASGDGLGDFSVAVIANPVDAAAGASIIGQGRTTGGPDYNQWALMANSSGFFNSNGTFEFGTIDTDITGLTNNAAQTIDGNYHRYMARRRRLPANPAGQATLDLFKDSAVALATGSGTIRNIGVESTSRIIMSGYPDGAGYEYSRRVRLGGGWNRGLPDALVARWMRNPYALLQQPRTWIFFVASTPNIIAVEKATLTLTAKSAFAAMQAPVSKAGLSITPKAALVAMSTTVSKSNLVLTGKAALAAINAPANKAAVNLSGKSAQAALSAQVNKATLGLTGKSVQTALSAPASKANLNLTGKAAQAALTAPVAKASVTLTPKEVFASSGNIVSVVKTVLNLTGKSVSAVASALVQKATLTLTGKAALAALSAPATKAALTLTAKSTQAHQVAFVQPAMLSLTAKSAFAHRSFIVVKTALSLIGKTVSALVGMAVTGIKVTMRYRPAVDLAIEGAAATDLVVKHRSAVDLEIAYRRAE